MRPLRGFSRAMLALSIAIALPSCAGAQRWTSEVSDYEDYRRVRLAQGVDERLRQGWHYLKANPRGAYRSEVKPWFVALEEQMRLQGWNYEPKLERLLGSLPDGPHAEQMRVRLAELKHLKAIGATREREFLQTEQGLAARFERARAARVEFIRGVQATLRELAAVRVLGKPTAEWESTFKKKFFEETPRGHCEGSRCVRHFFGEFDIPAGRGLTTRLTNYALVLILDGEHLAAIELSGPQLFTQLSEAATVRAVLPRDLQGRTEAIATAVQLLALAVETEFPEARCAAEVVSPTVLARECDGRKLTAELDEYADLDRVRIVATQASSSAAPQGVGH